jgi:hypothetical protein
MGYQIIKQPNGKFCILSSSIDNVTDYNCTKDELIEVFVEIHTEQITSEVNRVIDRLEQGEKPYLRATKTYEEMIEHIRVMHSKKEAQKVKKMIET